MQCLAEHANIDSILQSTGAQFQGEHIVGGWPSTQQKICMIMSSGVSGVLGETDVRDVNLFPQAAVAKVNGQEDLIMLTPQIPTHFVAFIEHMHAEAGRAWLMRLPQILTHCAARWNLTLGQPFPNLTYHFVLSATRPDGQPVVLKICAPTKEYAEEAAAIGHFGGHGMAQLLDTDADEEALLLERLMPGTTLRPLADIADDAATRIAAGVMRQLWRPVISDFPFPTIQQWREGLTHLRDYYGGGTGPFSPTLVDAAESIYADFTASLAPLVLLHGDLHHDNILAAERAPWLAIDPKGLVGEPAYEVGAFLYNPQDIRQRAELPRILARRLDILAEELAIDRARLHGWGLYTALLSAWWDVEDLGHIGEDSLRCAEVLASLPGLP